MPKDPLIRALKKFRKVLLENEDVKVINGRVLPETSEVVLEKYKIISDKMKSVGLIKKEKKINLHNFNYKGEEDVGLSKLAKSLNMVEKDENSFLSIETENEKRYKEENFNLKNSLKSLNFFRSSMEKEKMFIDGFKIEPEKEEGIIRKLVKSQFKSNGEFFQENMELLQKGKQKFYFI
jgi:hypothetical protein